MVGIGYGRCGEASKFQYLKNDLKTTRKGAVQNKRGESENRPTKMILIFYLKEKLKWPHPKEISV